MSKKVTDVLREANIPIIEGEPEEVAEELPLSALQLRG